MNLASESRVWLMQSRRRLSVFSATGGRHAALLPIIGWHHYYTDNRQSGITVLEQAKAFMSGTAAAGMDEYGKPAQPRRRYLTRCVTRHASLRRRGRRSRPWPIWVGIRAGVSARMREQTYRNCWSSVIFPALFNGPSKR